MTRSPDDALGVLRDVSLTSDSPQDYGPLDELLWQERQLLERLSYQLAAQQAVICAGELRWLQLSDTEVRSAVEDLRAHEVLRAVETEHLLHTMHCPADTTLTQLVATAPMPWSAMLDDHRLALCELEHGIRATAARTVALLENRGNGDRS